MLNEKKVLGFLAVVLAWSAWSLMPSPAIAAGCTSGQLVRASNPSVYYCGADGKRYVFPNQATYNSWYADFSGVRRITDDELAAIPIGGNVTYRPGVRMVKITSSPRVYVVGAGGLLRAIPSEAVATALYGSGWNRMIDDVPDAFFVNYRLGADLAASADFSPATERASAATINADRALTSSSCSASGTCSSAATVADGVTMTLSPDVSRLASGDSTTITVTAHDATGIATASIFVNGSLLKLCQQTGNPTTATCSKVIYGSDYADGAILSIYGQEVNRYGTRSVSGTRTVTTSGGSTATASVTLDFSRKETTLSAGQNVTVTAAAYDPNGLSSVSVFVNGSLMQRCSQNGTVTSASCSAVIYADNYSTGSTVSVYGQAINAGGTPTLSATTNLSVTSSASSSGSVTVEVLSGVTSLKTDETADVLVSAYDKVGFSNLALFVNGTRLQNCAQGGSSTRGTCRVTLTGSGYSAGTSLSLYGQATNTDGSVYVSSTLSLPVIAGSTLSNAVSLSFSPYAQSLATSQSTTVTATAKFSHSVSGITVYVNGSEAKTCSFAGSGSTGTCSVVLNGSSYAAGGSVAVYAEASSSSGEYGKSSTSTIGVTSPTNAAGTVVLYTAPTLSTISGTQNVTVTAIAYDPSGLASVNILVNGGKAYSCSQSGSWPTGASCSYVISAANYAPGTSLNIYGQGVNTLNATTSSATTTIKVN